ncbi:hypothetical protein [Rhodococcus sp. NPDC127528]|uniref:hypothetical protein n=1 Tax=unclassified Rhodococcus (in: high G+C Gram-positive bacteria) TaxID=192944 RepID=UPI003626D170
MARALSSVATPAANEEFETTSVWDPRSECRFVAARPADEPELWSAYLAGALESYAQHDVLRALEYNRIRDGSSTALFFVAIAPDGSVDGGLRAQGPYDRADQAHATEEWSGQPGERAVSAMIADRLPFGVVEMKAAWVREGASKRRALTQSLAHVGVRALELLDVQFLMASAADHVLKLWASSGGAVATAIPPTPYPDDRYETRIMWWDRDSVDCRTAAQQFARLCSVQNGSPVVPARRAGGNRDATA